MCGMQMEEEEIPFAQLEEEADDLANLMQSMHQCLDEVDDGGGEQDDAKCSRVLVELEQIPEFSDKSRDTRICSRFLFD